MLNFPNIDPVAFSIFGFQVHWYGIAYAVGILFTIHNAQKLCRTHKNTPINEKHIDDLFTYGLLGIILGGRLGYVLFYNLDFFLNNPEKIFAIWEGGMSFHGGFIGVLIATLIYTRKESLSFLYLTDRIAPGACIGLMLGRLSNFINGELWGKATTLPWGMVFPNADNIARHPSQLYEAAFEGLILYFLLYYLARKQNKEGIVSAIFLISYGLVRFLIEFVREPDDIEFLQQGLFNYISMGQLLSLPMIVAGIYILHRTYRKQKEIDDSIQAAYQDKKKQNQA